MIDQALDPVWRHGRHDIGGETLLSLIEGGRNEINSRAAPKSLREGVDVLQVGHRRLHALGQPPGVLGAAQ